jgi:hypothetical protein
MQVPKSIHNFVYLKNLHAMKYFIPLYFYFILLFSCSSNKEKTDVDKHLDSLQQADFEQLKDDVEQLKIDVDELKQKDSLNSRL